MLKFVGGPSLSFIFVNTIFYYYQWGDIFYTILVEWYYIGYDLIITKKSHFLKEYTDLCNYFDRKWFKKYVFHFIKLILFTWQICFQFDLLLFENDFLSSESCGIFTYVIAKTIDYQSILIVWPYQIYYIKKINCNCPKISNFNIRIFAMNGVGYNTSQIVY